MRKIRISILFLLVVLTWGTTWLAMRIAVETIPPIFATGMRFIFAAPLLICIAWFAKTPILFPRGQRLFQFVVCLFYFAIPFSLMIYGETYVSSGLASIIFANMPVAVLIASILFLNVKTNKAQVTGLIIALVALASILLEESGASMASHWQGGLALIVAVIMHATLYVQCKKRSCTISVITFNALPSCLAGLILVMVSCFLEVPQFQNFSSGSIFATLYLGVFAGFFGILCYFSLQKHASAFQASLVFLVFPLIAVCLEDYVYGYAISTQSMLLIVPLGIGILLTLVSRGARTTSERLVPEK